jgi:hypothetical protein
MRTFHSPQSDQPRPKDAMPDPVPADTIPFPDAVTNIVLTPGWIEFQFVDIEEEAEYVDWLEHHSYGGNR